MTDSVGVLPTVSVIVPCRNEEQHIETCLRSILAFDPPAGGFELLVADGMSNDRTGVIVERLAREDSRVRVVTNDRGTTSSGLNAGIRAAKGLYIAVMGAHNRYAKDYLVRSLEVLDQTGADNVGGTMICEGTSLTQRAIAAAHHTAFAVGGARWHRLAYDGPADTVFGGVYRREVFNRIGLFDEELIRNQDDEFNLRLTRAGGKIWHSRHIRSWYSPRASVRALWRQYSQYGYWKVRVIQKHKLPASLRHLVPGGFVCLLLLLACTGLFWRPALSAAALLLIAYALATIVAAGVAARRFDWWLLPILPVVFACYHFSYGTGFVRGLWDFVILRRGGRELFTGITR